TPLRCRNDHRRSRPSRAARPSRRDPQGAWAFSFGASDRGRRELGDCLCGIDRHVVGAWPDWFGYELPAAEGEAWCRVFNEAQLAAAKSERRFVPLASVPLQDGARAAAVLKAAVAAGLSA